MRDIERMREIVEEEIGKIADKGLNTSNLETAYKLIEMLSHLKHIDYWDVKCDYYMTVLREMRNGDYSRNSDYSQATHHNTMMRHNDNYDRGSSYARRGEHYVRGHYSRADGEDDYDRYMEHKHSYRSGDKSADCKQRMVDALERHMDALTDEIAEMGRDADCTEEKRVIEKYIDKLKRMM